jgi:integrase
MTDKNYLRLSQFDDETVLKRFLDFPIAEINRLRRKRMLIRNDAVAISTLIALEILVHVPLRIGNLAALCIGETLLLPPRGQPGEAVIFIPRRKVKNRYPLQFVLTEEATGLVRYYVDNVKPLLEDEPTNLLFPNKSGGAKRSDTLSKQISALVEEKVGIDFNPHLIRHLVAKLNVDERPGNYEGPRRLLGHKSSDTTLRHFPPMKASKPNPPPGCTRSWSSRSGDMCRWQNVLAPAVA